VRALVHDPAAPFGLRLGEAPDPVPGSAQALVAVAATSLNFGELDLLAERTDAGGVSGWDAAGVVVRAAADGTGPPAGSRVVTYGPDGAWAELRAVETDGMAVLPDGVDIGDASAVPVAGVTALRAVRALGPIAVAASWSRARRAAPRAVSTALGCCIRVLLEGRELQHPQPLGRPGLPFRGVRNVCRHVS
jgi:NADPH:quinone reductase-like Zn-dependent oxidoreductase